MPISFAPTAGSGWPTARPEEVGVDCDRLSALVEFANEHEAEPDRRPEPATHKAELLRRVLGPDADVDIVGPFTRPGRLNGLVFRRGRLLVEFGNTEYVDEIASATKSYLALLCGVAIDRGVIRDVHGSVFDDTSLAMLGDPHNRRITWHQLLQQTSEWDGVLFDKVPTGHRGERVGEPLQEPGTFWEYNDVRVNLLSRCLLEVFRRPLPEILAEAIMTPIGASSTWSWHGYSSSNVTIDGHEIESVSGGAHWGGGIWMNSRDLARVGHLYLHGGRWRGQQLLSENWIEHTREPCDLNYMYGYLWWLQHDANGRQVCFAAQGGGSHHCFVIPDHEMVIVVRWIRDDAWKVFLDQALSLVVDREHLGPIEYDFTRINRS